MAGQGGARQQRTLRTAGGISGTTKDVDEDEDEAVAVNRICMGALSISHLQKTTRKTPKKRRPGCLSAGSEYQLPTLRYRGDYGRVLWLPREKREEKRRKNEEKQQMKEQNVTTNATKRKVGVDKQMKIGNPAAHD